MKVLTEAQPMMEDRDCQTAPVDHELIILDLERQLNKFTEHEKLGKKTETRLKTDLNKEKVKNKGLNNTVNDQDKKIKVQEVQMEVLHKDKEEYV